MNDEINLDMSFSNLDDNMRALEQPKPSTIHIDKGEIVQGSRRKAGKSLRDLWHSSDVRGQRQSVIRLYEAEMPASGIALLPIPHYFVQPA